MFSQKKKKHQIRFAQNFLQNPALARKLIQKNLKQKEVVIEIGPGRGIITKELSAVAKEVVAIEKDKKLIASLKDQFKQSNVNIVSGDVLKQPTKSFGQHYSVFSNPPFNITSKIVKHFLLSETPPAEMHLFTQKEAANRFMGKPHEFELSVLTKPWFSYKISHQFDSTDFKPIPNIDVVLLSIRALSSPLLSLKEKTTYQQLVTYIFSQKSHSAEKAFKHLFTHQQWKKLAKSNDFKIKSTLRELSIEQWVGIYNYFKVGVSKEKKSVIE